MSWLCLKACGPTKAHLHQDPAAPVSTARGLTDLVSTISTAAVSCRGWSVKLNILLFITEITGAGLPMGVQELEQLCGWKS